MFTLACLVIQTACVLISTAMGAYLVGGLNLPTKGEPSLPTQRSSMVDLLPDPASATVQAIQQGMTLLGETISRLESGQADQHDYEEASALAQWALSAGRAVEERLAHQIAQEEQSDRMEQSVALSVIERGLAARVSQRALASMTGWSKSWVAEQCKRLAGS